MLRDAGQRQVDEWQLETARERAREAFRRRDALVQHGLGERAALLDPAADCGEPVAGDEARSLDQVGDELRDLVDGKAVGQAGLPADGGRVSGLGFAREAQLVWAFEVHEIPRTRYRQNPPES